MKELFVNSSMKAIKKQYPHYTKEKLEQLNYGLTGLYITVSKTIIITLIAFLLGILKELIIFTLLYNIIRMPSFGLHAKNSIICLITSTIIFITLPFICIKIIIPKNIILILGIIGIILIAKNSPADTHKRPIINPIRRRNYKIISTFIALTYVLSALIIKDNFISNCLIFSIILQCFIISPVTYKIFNMPYNNYKTYKA